MVTHETALQSAQKLKTYCDDRFDPIRGERGCHDCIFSVGGDVKRCILNHYLGGTMAGLAESAVMARYKELK